MVNVKFYTFSKDSNSTKLPAAADLKLSADCQIFEPCSIITPTITIKSAAPKDVTFYNYCYISDFGRYYYIRDWQYINGLWTASLACDVLSTYKSQIGAENLYILRASAASNGNIVDHYYPTTAVTYGKAEEDPFTPTGYGLGNYIVNVVGTATTGNSTLWLLSPADFRTFISRLYANIDGFQFSDVISALQKLAGGLPNRLVSSAMWLPAYNFDVAATDRIKVGTWDSGVDGNIITDPVFSMPAVELTLPKHPQAAARGSFLNLAPYTTYTLDVPFFGIINIDTTAVKDASTIYINRTVDAVTGQGKCYVHSGGNPRPIIAELTAQIGAAVPLQGQSGGASIAGGIVSTIMNTAVAVATGGIGAAASAVAAGFGTAISALTGASCSTGSMGGALSTQRPMVLDATFLNIAPEDNAKNGRPLCEVRKPSNLGGFMIVQRGDIPIPGTAAEADAIKTILESGFYYE